ncbi:MAG: DNA-binding response regulator [Crocinitomix sp.]|nr:DNA-binding response regulator [Crocinitomix sp.]
MSLHQLAKYLFLLSLIVLVVPNSRAETNDQLTKLILRTIGHEFLLQLDDSTSRVLPIEKIDGRYAVQFEREFSFEPNLLLFATFKALEESKISDSYIVEVEKCLTKGVIHSFKASLATDDNMVPCQLRELPKDCYVFYFTVIENDQKADSEEKGEGGVLKSIFTIIILIIGVGVVIYLLKRRKRPKLKLINIGQFQFDQRGMTLTMKARSTELSSKESDLLYLLFSNENKTLKREYILKVVWGDDGDYVGRTLDVFISKLRKKLEADSSLKIVNIRGVGYRFVIN